MMGEMEVGRRKCGTRKKCHRKVEGKEKRRNEEEGRGGGRKSDKRSSEKE